MSSITEINLCLPGSTRMPHPAQRYPCFVIASFRLEIKTHEHKKLHLLQNAITAFHYPTSTVTQQAHL
jgi:hypothetical protein